MTELLVGRVLAVGDHPGARGPSYLLRVDLGGRGERDAQMEPGAYSEDLVGRLVVISLDDEAIVLMARSHDGSRLVVPDGDVAPGTVVA